MVRHSLNYVGWKERKAVASDLRLIYRAATEAEGFCKDFCVSGFFVLVFVVLISRALGTR
jgi:hypothetical protein